MAPVPAPDEDGWAELVPPALSLRPDDIKEYCVLFYLLLHYPAVLGCWVLVGRGGAGGFFCSECLIISGVVFMKADGVAEDYIKELLLFAFVQAGDCIVIEVRF